MCGTIKTYIFSRTSKPVSRLVKASCNPLSADKILSITVPISVRCSSEMAARPTSSLRTSDRIPDGVGLFVCSLRELNAGDFGGLWDYLLTSPDPERPSVTTLWGHPLLERRSPGEAFRSPSSLEEDPPKTSSAERGYGPNFKICAVVIFSEKR